MDPIHPTALVSPDASLGKNVEIGPYSVIHAGVDIGDESKVGAFCEIGIPTPLAKSPTLRIEKSARIRSHAVIYAGSHVGRGFTTGHYVNVRENAVIGDGFQLGNRSDVQGDCHIGQYVRTHADVHIGKGSVVGNYVWLYPQVLLTNDPDPPSEALVGSEIGDFAVIAAKVLLMPGVHVGRECVIGAAAVVTRDIEPGRVAKGNPAVEVCDASLLRLHSHPGKHAYPWRDRFRKGYPESVIQEWLKQIDT